MADIENVINGINTHLVANDEGCEDCPYVYNPPCESNLLRDVLELLKPLAESKRPDNLREGRYWRIGDCPVCHRVVEFAQKHCHNCTQLLDWTEVLEMPCEDEDSSGT